MSGTAESRLSRLEAKLESVGEQVIENRRASQAESEKVREILDEVKASLNQWAGVRAALIGLGAIVSGIAAIAGAAAAYFFHKT